MPNYVHRIRDVMSFGWRVRALIQRKYSKRGFGRISACRRGLCECLAVTVSASGARKPEHLSGLTLPAEYDP